MTKIKISPLVLYFMMLITTSIWSYCIVISNFENGIYTATQDSIAIPIIAITLALVTLFIFSLFQLPLFKRLKYFKKTSIISTTPAVLASALSFALLFECTYYWLTPNHLTISILYLITLLVYLSHQIKFYKNFISRTK
ncbi:hypothetical protein BK660_23725 [Pseudomonas brassicacearum]|uniref:Uncharacterized protein n=1 Tax=Pseudomonas brassicacearum TaxID=930166 RepID=A0A423HWU2_9PSED|nr:hypothetical protein BK660_23725 [Pseudomonas brassicacearum]